MGRKKRESATMGALGFCRVALRLPGLQQLHS